MRRLIINCDCCAKEIEEKDVFRLEHYIHVAPWYNRMQGHARLIDGKMYDFSGRTETRDFCLPCYNRLLYNLFEQIKIIRG